ncbi:MAG: methionyl-tRNA formyltransferase [Patescibacteria group bacterium]
MPNRKDLNFVFFGTPDVANETLTILKNSGYIPTLIVTAPDKPQGRNLVLTAPPVKNWAIENNIPYIQPEKITLEELKITSSDLFIVVAYGKILPENIIIFPQNGCLNIHYSLLPKYRGASPVESAILHGDTETGVTIQKMEYKMDSGPIVAQEKTIIPPDEKASDLKKRLIQIGGDLLVKTLPDFIDGKIECVKQNEEQSTYCAKIKKENGLVDLEKDLPENIYNKFRAYATWPRTFFFKDNKRIIITDAVMEDGKFTIKKVLPEGKKEIDYLLFLSQ